MEFHDILQFIGRRLWIIILGTVLAAAIAVQLGTKMEPVYKAKVVMKVDQPVSAPLVYSSISTGESLASTYSNLLRTRPLLEAVVAHLGLDMSPEELRASVSTHLVEETPLLELSVEHSDARQAATIANDIAATFIADHNKERQLENITAFQDDLLAQMTDLKARIEQTQALVDQPPTPPAVPTPGVPRESPQEALAVQQSTYANLLSSYLDLQLTQSQFFNVNVVEPAVAPGKPIRPQIPLYTFLGAFLGFMLTTGTLFLAQYLDRSVKTNDDLRRILSRPTLGTIPQLPDMERQAGPVTRMAPYSAAAEAFRSLRTNVRFASVDKPLGTVLITSAEPGAGKTTVAMNLAVVYAQAGFRVALIDADLRLPSLQRFFKLDNATGLTALLTSDTDDVAAYLRPTQVDGLYLMTSGSVPPNPSEMLGSRRMEAVIEGAKRFVDLVILDAPPVLPVTDAAVLAPKVDGVLLVARANKTPRDALRQAAEGLLQVGGHLVGTVLNAVPRSRSSYYDYYREDSVQVAVATTAAPPVSATIRSRGDGDTPLDVSQPTNRPFIGSER